jgi:hypothetical protein
LGAVHAELGHLTLAFTGAAEPNASDPFVWLLIASHCHTLRRLSTAARGRILTVGKQQVRCGFLDVSNPGFWRAY